ncbi:hypothetical protein STEG23_001970, partial [Scotinomys teguina]
MPVVVQVPGGFNSRPFISMPLVLEMLHFQQAPGYEHHMCVGAGGNQKRALDSRELELKNTFVGSPKLALGFAFLGVLKSPATGLC